MRSLSRLKAALELAGRVSLFLTPFSEVICISIIAKPGAGARMRSLSILGVVDQSPTPAPAALGQAHPNRGAAPSKDG